MDLRNIETFILTAELKSFTAAARELNYVQSTVTMQIQQLEKELGYPLFDRIGKKISLTGPGLEFLRYAYEIQQSARKAQSLGQDPATVRGILRLGVSESILFSIVTDLLPVFKEKYPLLDLRIKIGHTPGLTEQLKQNQLDMIYLSADCNTDPDLKCLYQRREPLIFTGNPGNNPPYTGTPLQPADLFGQQFVFTERDGVCYRRLSELAAQYNVSLPDSLEIDSVHVVAELVEKGMGIAFLPEYAIEKKLREGQLIRLPAAIPPQYYYSQILCHKSRWLSPFMIEFVEEIKQLRPSAT